MKALHTYPFPSNLVIASATPTIRKPFPLRRTFLTRRDFFSVRGDCGKFYVFEMVINIDAQKPLSCWYEKGG